MNENNVVICPKCGQKRIWKRGEETSCPECRKAFWPIKGYSSPGRALAAAKRRGYVTDPFVAQHIGPIKGTEGLPFTGWAFYTWGRDYVLPLREVRIPRERWEEA